MIIKRLTGKEILPAKAITVTGKDGSSHYFNLKHGSYGKSMSLWWCGFATRYFKPEGISDTLILDSNDYIIVPIKDGDKVKRNRDNNACYYISKDDMEYHKTDILLLWEIPNRNYIDVTYELTGSVSEIGCASTGKQRDDILCKSPAPILEITGDCKLSWVATDHNGDKFHQVIRYDSSINSWDIKPIEKIKGVKDDNKKDKQERS